MKKFKYGFSATACPWARVTRSENLNKWGFFGVIKIKIINFYSKLTDNLYYNIFSLLRSIQEFIFLINKESNFCAGIFKNMIKTSNDAVSFLNV